MKPKLSRREAALVRHARSRAIADYEASRAVRVIIGDLTFRQSSLSQLRSMNQFLHSAAGEEIQVIFDKPIFCKLQWIYWPDGFDPMI